MESGATSGENEPPKRKQQQQKDKKKKKGGHNSEKAQVPITQKEIGADGDHDAGASESSRGEALTDSVKNMALDDEPETQATGTDTDPKSHDGSKDNHDSNNSNSNNSNNNDSSNSNSNKDNSPMDNGTTNGGDAEVIRTLREQLEKQQKLALELRNGLKRYSAEWETEKKGLQAELEQAAEKHAKELEESEKRYQQALEEKQDLDTKYRGLIDRVATIKEKMGEKLKADAEALSESRNTVSELEEQNRNLNNALDDLRTEYRKLNEESTDAVREAANLRSRLSLSQQNWLKEREEMLERENYLREEFDSTKQAMQDWEVIAIEERAMRESLADRVVELEDQLGTYKTGYEKAIEERDRESSTIDGLQRALQEIQEARKQELKEIIEGMQGSIDKLTLKAQTMEQRAMEAEAQLVKTREDLEKFQQFEKEVKEKNLLIGKLRHEAVTLNDHLTKALRMLKKGNASDNVDKQLVTNVFLSFLSIQRGDTKKYEVLQLIASVLDWNDEQRERAGLVRPGGSNNNPPNNMPPSFSRAASPLMPYHRTPSTPTLNDPYDGSRELWSSVLDSPSSSLGPPKLL